VKLRTSAPKANGVGVHREVTSAQTYARVKPHLLRAGITRVADITGLDRIGIPVYNAISPRSNDIISVYNGKGLTAIDAKTSAVMEGIERFSAWLPRRPDAIATYDELVAQGRSVMHPGEYVDDLPISWTLGYDLLNGEEVLVPQDGACYSPKFHEAPCYKITTTNGLASGNTIEEAICHALCEVIERDAITISEVLSSQLCQVLEKGLSSVPAQSREVTGFLRELNPHVSVSSLPERAQSLIAKIHAARLEMRVIQLNSDLGIPSFMAATAEDMGPTVSQGHGGFGTHPDAEVAIIRAITECAQGRAVDIQAMREDISLPGTEVPKHMYHVRRSSTFDKGAWIWNPMDKVLDAADLPTYQHDDVMDDVRLMLSRLRRAGIERAIVVDFSPPHIPVSVVRVIVPGLESWAVDHCKLGDRARAAWKQAVQDISARHRALATTNAG
jgi:ribosomal protein S12 methylthiotransferase accessory factor